MGGDNSNTTRVMNQMLIQGAKAIGMEGKEEFYAFDRVAIRLISEKEGDTRESRGGLIQWESQGGGCKCKCITIMRCRGRKNRCRRSNGIDKGTKIRIT